MILSYDLLKPEDEKEENKDKTSIKEDIDLFNQCKSFSLQCSIIRFIKDEFQEQIFQ